MSLVTPVAVSVVTGENRLDLVVLIRFQPLGELLDRDTLAPFDIDAVHVQLEPFQHVHPEMGELAEPADQDLVARRQGIGDRRFPATGAGAREQENLAGFGLKIFFRSWNSGKVNSGKSGARISSMERSTADRM